MHPIGLLQSPGTPDFPFEVILEYRDARAEDGTAMFVILWEYEVKPGNAARFERVYSPSGDWACLFQRDPHFRGTQLLSVPSRDHCFLTLDYWDTETDYRAFLAVNQAAYGELDRSCEDLTVRERHVTSFTL
jgi:heme-degrading monooxygenase HmoA